MSTSDNLDIFKLEWYYIDVADKEPKGPISIRDIDVMMRTNAIDTSTYVWREGMDDWKKIFQIEELKDIANVTHTEIQESLIRTKIQSSYNNLGQKIENSNIENYYFGSDGFWHVYNPITKIWTSQEKKPQDRKKSVESAPKDGNKTNFDEDDEGSIGDQDGYNEIQPRKQSINEYHIEYQSDYQNEYQNDHQQQSKIESEHELLSIQVENLSDISNITKKEKLLQKKRKPSIDPQITEEDEKALANLTEKELKKIEKRKKKKEKQKEKKKQQWYMPRINANVYVSGLPNDITESELIAYFSRCGFIRKDQRTGENKVKLYKDKNGNLKGDALISFLREESVAMAIEILNDTEIRPGYKISVDKAQFEQKGDYKARESYKLDQIQRYKLKTDVERKLGWNEEDDEKGLKIVILKNMFESKDFYEDEALRQDLELDIIDECETNFGQVDKFMIFEEHPEGIVKIKFHTPTAAEKCITALHHRYYNSRLIEAFYWDGKTDYTKFNEDLQSQEKRIDEFGQWLESDETATLTTSTNASKVEN